MIKIGILGGIGSGKSYVAKQYGCPVFDADAEVTKIYKKNRICFNRLKNKLVIFYLIMLKTSIINTQISKTIKYFLR